jgi:hypothetical protein
MRLIQASIVGFLSLAGCSYTFKGAPPATVSVGAVPAADACASACGAPASCRAGVHRMYNGGSGEHFYTATLGEGTTSGFTQEAADYFRLASTPAPGLAPLHRCLMNYGKHFYTTAANCEGVSPGTEEGTLGYLSTTPQCGAVALYRSYNPQSNDHFYTVDATENAHATQGGGYKDEGVIGYVWLAE